VLKIAVLTCNPRSYSSRRLCEVAKRRGHEARRFDTLRFSLLVHHDAPALFYAGERFDAPDLVLPRIGGSVTTFGLAVVRQLEALGAVSANSAQAITACRDKLCGAQLLAARGVRVPATAFARQSDAIRPAIERLGGAPVVVKMLECSSSDSSARAAAATCARWSSADAWSRR
jgi:ribosomal protein S6--L-glutamate ligase